MPRGRTGAEPGAERGHPTYRQREKREKRGHPSYGKNGATRHTGKTGPPISGQNGATHQREKRGQPSYGQNGTERGHPSAERARTGPTIIRGKRERATHHTSQNGALGRRRLANGATHWARRTGPPIIPARTGRPTRAD